MVCQPNNKNIKGGSSNEAKRLADKHLAMYAEGFLFVFSGAIFGIRWFESFDSKKNRKWIYGNPKKVRREKAENAAQ